MRWSVSSHDKEHISQRDWCNYIMIWIYIVYSSNFLNITLFLSPNVYLVPYPRYHCHEAYGTLQIHYMTKVCKMKSKFQRLKSFTYVYCLLSTPFRSMRKIKWQRTVALTEEKGSGGSWDDDRPTSKWGGCKRSASRNPEEGQTWLRICSLVNNTVIFPEAPLKNFYKRKKPKSGHGAPLRMHW